GKIAPAAKACGIGVRTLSRKMRFYGIDKKVYGRDMPKASQSSKEYLLSQKNPSFLPLCDS
ncbi:MAG: hypothetical protein ACE5HC_07980, partial [Candidatus Binatia bacterium]